MGITATSDAQLVGSAQDSSPGRSDGSWTIPSMPIGAGVENSVGAPSSGASDSGSAGLPGQQGSLTSDTAPVGRTSVFEPAAQSENEGPAGNMASVTAGLPPSPFVSSGAIDPQSIGGAFVGGGGWSIVRPGERDSVGERIGHDVGASVGHGHGPSHRGIPLSETAEPGPIFSERPSSAHLAQPEHESVQHSATIGETSQRVMDLGHEFETNAPSRR